MDALINSGRIDENPKRFGLYDEFVGRIEPLIESTIENLRCTNFRRDPIVDERYSRATSIISSAYKRHAQILGHAILERLKDCSRLRVWKEDAFRLSYSSMIERQKRNHLQSCLNAELPYGDSERTITIDMMVYDIDSHNLCSYSIRRGNGSYDGGKRQVILDNLIRSNMLLRDYGRQIGIEPRNYQSHIIFYYGVRSIGEPFSIIGDELDEHFSFPVQETIEAVNLRFRHRLRCLLEES